MFRSFSCITVVATLLIGHVANCVAGWNPRKTADKIAHGDVGGAVIGVLPPRRMESSQLPMEDSRPRASDRRAPEYDRQRNPTPPRITPDANSSNWNSNQPPTTRQRVDWQRGLVFQGTFVGDHLVSERVVGRANLERRIDPMTGVIFEGQFINGQLISERPVNRAR